MAKQGNWKSRFDPDAEQSDSFPPKPKEVEMKVLLATLKSKTMMLMAVPLTVLGLVDTVLNFTSQNPVITNFLAAYFPALGPLLVFLGALAAFLRAITKTSLAEKVEN